MAAICPGAVAELAGLAGGAVCNAAGEWRHRSSQNAIIFSVLHFNRKQWSADGLTDRIQAEHVMPHSL